MIADFAPSSVRTMLDAVLVSRVPMTSIELLSRGAKGRVIPLPACGTVLALNVRTGEAQGFPDVERGLAWIGWDPEGEDISIGPGVEEVIGISLIPREGGFPRLWGHAVPFSSGGHASFIGVGAWGQMDVGSTVSAATTPFAVEALWREGWIESSLPHLPRAEVQRLAEILDRSLRL